MNIKSRLISDICKEGISSLLKSFNVNERFLLLRYYGWLLYMFRDLSKQENL